jgi:hypothetical protein
MKKLLIILMLLPAWALAESKSISNDTDIEDASMSSANPTLNYGGSATNAVDGVAVNYERGLIRIKNLSDSLGVGATITDCGCSLYVSNESGSDVISAYRALKPWVEGTQTGQAAPPGATWEDWDNDDYEWGTAGADNADDGGSDNSGDGSGYDRWATASGSITIDVNGAYYDLELPDSLCQKWYDGTYNENGLVLIGDASLDAIFNSIDNASNKPIFYFTYTPASADKEWPVKR